MTRTTKLHICTQHFVRKERFNLDAVITVDIHTYIHLNPTIPCLFFDLTDPFAFLCSYIYDMYMIGDEE